MNVTNFAVLQTTSGDNVPLQGVTARGNVRGLLFELEVEQRYRNSGETNIEAVYTFPLPSDAVLLGLDVELDGRKLTATVVEKKEAEENYEKALDKGDSAIMLERGANGLLSMNLGNLMAGENAVIRYRAAAALRSMACNRVRGTARAGTGTGASTHRPRQRSRGGRKSAETLKQAQSNRGRTG